ncbi:MAG: hypothetical protein Q7R56_00275, partial [Nanoarchaeota archaeon]|nr:hypothetical protein [Nanoarchaeota archaeon]
MRFLPLKALIQITIILFSIFTIYTPATTAITYACCEKTTSGENCQYAPENECNQNYNHATTTCDQTPYCTQQCCYQPTTGICSVNVPAARCTTSGGQVLTGNQCEAPQCQLGCCTIGNNYQLTTEQQCTNLNKNYQSSQEDNFDEEITDESICLSQQYNQATGCCINDETCQATTQEQCSGTFQRDNYCSTIAACSCQTHKTKGCGTDGIYWYDSCGNQEEKIQACNEEEVCQQQGNAVSCESVNCATTQAYDHNPHDLLIASGGARKQGESWCVYESPVGKFLDYPGSRHYVHACSYGKELVEPCRDYREEICLQNQVHFQGQTYNQARCIYNDIEDTKIGQNITTVPQGGVFWKGTKNEDQPLDDLKKTCKARSSTCTVIYIKKDKWSDWKCEQNCECEKQAFIDQAANYCKAAGDCGADYNIAGEKSSKGLVIKWAGDIQGPTPKKVSQKQWQKWKDYGVHSGILKLSQAATAAAQQPTAQNILMKSVTNNLLLFAINSIAASFAYSIATSTALDAAFSIIFSTQFSSIGTIGLNTLTGGVGGLVSGTTAITAGAGIPAGTLVTSGTVTLAPGATVAIGGETFTAGTQATTLSITQTGGQATTTITGGGLTSATGEAAPTLLGGTPEIGSAGATAAGEGAAITPTSSLASTIGVVLGVAMFIYGIITGDIGMAITGLLTTIGTLILPGIGTIIGAILGTIIQLVMGGAEYAEKTVKITCRPWVAPAGGKNCESCGDNLHPCTEYQCKSLGAACNYINAGTNQAACIETNPNDANAPTIQPDTHFMQDYTIQKTPKGFYIANPIPAFTTTHIGIITDEPASCSYDNKHTPTLEDMEGRFDETYTTQHNLTLALPPQQTYTYYVRCEDTHGNNNLEEYEIVFQTEQQPDLTPPLIQDFSLQNPAYLREGINNTPIIIYTNEPATCKWDKQDISYDEMTNITLCQQGTDYYGTNNYQCLGLLTNIQSAQENNYYIKCKDAAGNTQTQSTPLKLISTKKLNINTITPTGTLYTNNITLQTTTSEGAENGKATCSYAPLPTNYIPFFNTNNNIHTQQLNNLQLGTYTYYLHCQDKAGNTATETTTFTVDVDTQYPNLLYLYQDSNTIHIIFNEPATCEYDHNLFSTGTGISTNNGLSKEHTLTKNKETYITCKDKDG